MIICFIAIFVAQPWWLYGSGASYIFNWLNNYGTIIASVAAILTADYFICKKRRVDMVDLYSKDGGRYRYSHGWNIYIIISWAVSSISPLLGNTLFSYWADSGNTPNWIQMTAANRYIFLFMIAFIVYILLMKSGLGGTKEAKGYVSQKEHDTFTRIIGIK